MNKRTLLSLVLLAVISIPSYLWIMSSSASANVDAIAVKRGTITDQALAVGDVEPEHSITVTSTIPGTVKTLWHDEGDAVKAGDPLLSISPDPTPQDLDNAKRDLQQKQVTEKTAAAHLQRYQTLLKSGYVAQDDYDQASEDYQNDVLQRKLAEEQLSLLANGKATVAGQVIQSTVASPIDGYILTRAVDVGDPVVPQTESQPGDALFTIANMNDIVFKGQVNEIDVGKLHEGMSATITLGAFPDHPITGVLTKIALQSGDDTANDVGTKTSGNPSGGNNSANNSPFNVGFEVTIAHLKIPAGIKLRSGFSADAEITVTTANKALLVPERVLDFEGDKAFVWLPGRFGAAKPRKRAVQVGISDGINAEIISGLKAGELVLDDNPTATPSSTN